MSQGIGHLTGHMAVHIAAMNVAAPLLALLFSRLSRSHDLSAPWLGTAAVAQLALLWAWHVPLALDAAMISAPLMAAMHASLFAAALAFWIAVIEAVDRSPWRSVAALLITGKIVCLMGVLLTFANRPLYLMPHHGSAMPVSLDDQQLAGLIMLIACPLTYVLGATLITARWLTKAEADVPSGRSGGEA